MTINNRDTKKRPHFELASQQGESSVVKRTRQLPSVPQEQSVIDAATQTELNKLLEIKDNPVDFEVIAILREEMVNTQKEYAENNPDVIILSNHSEIQETSGLNRFKKFLKNNVSSKISTSDKKKLFNRFISENPNSRFFVQNHQKDITYGFREIELGGSDLRERVLRIIRGIVRN